MAVEDMVMQVREDDGSIAWVHRTDEPDVLGVQATREEGDACWSVFVNVAEFIREEPLESELRKLVAGALAGVKGVTSVEEEDRELWAVCGDAHGADLVQATAKGLQAIYPKMKSYLASL